MMRKLSTSPPPPWRRHQRIANPLSGIKERLTDDSGSVRRYVNVYVNEEDIRFLQDQETALKDGDEVSIIPAIAGLKKEIPHEKEIDRQIAHRSSRSQTRLWLITRQNYHQPGDMGTGPQISVITNVRKPA